MPSNDAGNNVGWIFSSSHAATEPDLTTAVDGLIEVMRRDARLTSIGFGRGNFHQDLEQSNAAGFPNVLVMPEGADIVKRGIGWQKEVARVHVMFRMRGTRETPHAKLQALYDRLRALLEEKPRLDGTTAVDRAKVKGWKPLYGKGADYVEDVADVTVELTMYRRV